MNGILPLVSVIIPIYNMKKYLSQCIESVIHQTYRKLEIVLVDDGSSDKSGKICDTYALRDSRIKVIHKENGGVSSARNIGIELSTGEWIYFIDPDDWIEANTLELAVNRVLDDQTDMCFFDYTEVYENKLKAKNSLSTKQELFLNLEDINALKLYFSGMGNCWNFIVKSCVAKKIKFSESLKIYEDVVFKFQIYGNLNSFSYIHNNLYYYRKIMTSATKQQSNRIEYPIIVILTFNLIKKSINQFKYPLNSEVIANSKLIGYFGMVVASFFKNNNLYIAIGYIKQFIQTKEFKQAILNYDKKLIGKTSRIYMLFGRPKIPWVVFVYIIWTIFAN